MESERVHLLKQKPNKLKSEMNIRLFVRERSLHTFCTFFFSVVHVLFQSWIPPTPIYPSPFKAQWRGVDLPSDFVFSRTPHRNITSRKVASTVIRRFSFSPSVLVKYTSNFVKGEVLCHMLSLMADMVFIYFLCNLVQRLTKVCTTHTHTHTK